MRRFVISVVIPLVSASCLPDAIPPAQRKNLVNPTGETYPVGYLICGWAASYAANTLAATLTQEILGFNTTFNMDMICSGTVAGYYGITGCRNYNDPTDRGCMQGVTYYHVSLEAWEGYANDWNYIQRTYASMAAKNLGRMGYAGPTAMFIPKPVQQQAYSTEGRALEFYRSWNASWRQPSRFFGSIASVDSSKLAPCSRTDLTTMDDAAMRRHVAFTGDIDGVVVNEELYSARCDDGFWWTPPSCRTDSSQCVPYITGGSGWQVEDMMQKFTFHNMPVAIAVASDWTNYQELPQSGEMTFYWWAPDPTFLDLDPILLQFPPYNAKEYSEGLYRTSASEIDINTIVSPDLAVLAPIVESFADKIDLPMSEMNALLLDQKTSEDSWENVTCRWLMANEDIWRGWIPDESECYPGFGLYDSIEDDFTDVRVNVTNKIVCKACPPGTFSQKMEDKKGETYICLPCDKGTSQASGAQMSCKPCKSGEFQDQVRSKECQRCAFGTYQDQEGQLSCKACPANTFTLGFGSIARSDCGCQEDFIDMDPTGGYSCVRCGEGMSCPALSQLVDLQSGEITNGAQVAPTILKGFFSATDSPTEVYRCVDTETCPGGPPGSCEGGLVGTPCSECGAGETWTGTLCEDCAGWRQFLWVLAILAIFTFWTLSYYLTTSKVTAKATVLFATTASFGMLVMSMQNLGLVGMMTVEWPPSLQGLFAVCQFLLLDIDSYGFSCVAGQNESVRYLLSVLIFPIGIGWMALCYGVSRCLPSKHHWVGSKVISTMGAFLQVGFSTMSTASLVPMMCYKHPNGLRSLLKYPGVICGSAEHSAMLVIGSIFLAIFVVGFVVICGYAVYKVPSWSIRRLDNRVGAVRFLVFRFRLDSWWFGVPLLLRGTLINLPVVFATDYPAIQVVAICMVLTTMMVMQMLAWPWKVPLLNLTDCIISFCIVLVVTNAALYLPKIEEELDGFAAGVSSAMLGCIGIAICMMFFMTLSALFYRTALGGKQELKVFNLGSITSSKELARKVKEMADELEKMDEGDLASKLAALAVFDVGKATTCITLLATEVAPPAEDGKTFKFNKRISYQSFDPSLKRRPQSRRSNSSRNSQTRSNVGAPTM